MRSLTLTCAIVVSSGSLLVSSIVPALAATTSVTAEGTTATISIQDAVFTGTDCLQVPFEVSFSEYASLDITAAQQGSSNTLTAFAYGEGVVNDTIQVCPSLDGAGTYLMSGTLNTSPNRGEFTNLPFTVSKAQSQVTGVRATFRKSTLKVTGSATGITPTGSKGAAGSIIITGMLSKSKGGTGKWKKLGTAYPDQFGKFEYVGLSKQKLKGAQITAALVDSDWCEPSEAKAKVK